jgi:hypothetical protein
MRKGGCEDEFVLLLAAFRELRAEALLVKGSSGLGIWTRRDSQGTIVPEHVYAVIYLQVLGATLPKKANRVMR